MDDDQEHENRKQGAGVTWWVRYAFVPVAVAVIAGASAVRAADLLKPISTSQPVESAPVVTVSPPPTGPTTGQDESAAVTQEFAPVTPTAAPPTATLAAPTEAPLEAPPEAPPTSIPTEAPTAAPPVETVAAPESAIGAAEAILGVHSVRGGEHLYCIGRGYGVTPQAIARVNHLADPSKLRVGQKLVIPDREWRGVTNGVVCDPQFPSPYAGRAVNIPIAPRAPRSGGGQPAGEAPAEAPAETPIETPVEAPPSTEAPPAYPPPEG